MTAIGPPQWQRVQTSDNNSFGTCWRHESAASRVFLILIATVNLAAVVLANIQAFKARGISDEYSESKYIGVAMAGMLQVFLVGVPVLFLVGENPPAFVLVCSSIIFLVSMSLLLLIFVPKILLVRHFKAHPQDFRASASRHFQSMDSSSGIVLDEPKIPQVSTPLVGITILTTIHLRLKCIVPSFLKRAKF